MTRRRTVLVTATFVLPVVFSLGALGRGRLLWPFAHYPMYSGLYGATTAITRAVGVTGDSLELPLPVRVEPAGLHLHVVIENARRQPDAPVRLTRIATAIRAEYERLRAVGEIDGPPLAAVRIYRDTIRLATKPHTRRVTEITRGTAP
ncbi:MAG: hypothetical protein H7Z74_07760 [Anaerolineae bacterium]|nr:hypothetical protein [Gemmatimonadaceae bacterium]